MKCERTIYQPLRFRVHACELSSPLSSIRYMMKILATIIKTQVLVLLNSCLLRIFLLTYALHRHIHMRAYIHTLGTRPRVHEFEKHGINTYVYILRTCMHILSNSADRSRNRYCGRWFFFLFLLLYTDLIYPQKREKKREKKKRKKRKKRNRKSNQKRR